MAFCKIHTILFTDPESSTETLCINTKFLFHIHLSNLLKLYYYYFYYNFYLAENIKFSGLILNFTVSNNCVKDLE